MKVCRRCLTEKPASEFRRDDRYADGLGSWCRECHRVRNSEWARENRERLSRKAADYRANNRDQARTANRKFKRTHAVEIKAATREWVLNNRDRRRATDAARKAAKLRATPPWVDRKAISRVYRLAILAERLTGIRMHVDHIVPLQHPLVCGLHVPANLQILPGNYNEAKRNHWPLPEYLDPFPAPPVQEAMAL